MPDTDTVTIRLELTPSEAASLHHFIATHIPVYHGNHTREAMLDIRHRIGSALKDAGVIR